LLQCGKMIHMPNISPNFTLIFLGLGAILLELFIGVATGFDLALLGTCLILGGIIGNVIGTWESGVVSAIVLALLYIFLGRKFIKSKLSVITHKTNIDDLVGRSGVVTKKITNNTAGQVKVGTELWRAVSDAEISLDTKVKVTEIEGVTLKVIKI